MSIAVDVRHRLGDFQITAQFASSSTISALFGRSGAGKTSLVRMISGLLRPQYGRIEINGKVLFDSQQGIDVPTHKRRVGYVFQDARLFPHLSVRQNLRYGQRLSAKAQRYAKFDDVVALLGLEQLLSRRPGRLSGGEKQRVAIARALLSSPRVLLLDEPLASLDSARKAEVLPYIETLRDQFDLPIVYVSHAVEEISRLAAHMVLLADGNVAAQGPVDELMSRLDLWPLTGRYEAGAVIEAKLLRHDQDYDISVLEFSGGTLIVPRIEHQLGTRLRIRVRARDIALALHAVRGISIRNQIAARIVEITDESGSFAEVRLDAAGTALVARVTRLTIHELALTPGQNVYALIKSVALDRRSLGHIAAL